MHHAGHELLPQWGAWNVLPAQGRQPCVVGKSVRLLPVVAKQQVVRPEEAAAPQAVVRRRLEVATTCSAAPPSAW